MCPVEDHPVHPSVRHDVVIAGCIDGPTSETGYWARDGYVQQVDANGRTVAIAKMKWITHEMTNVCRQIGIRENGQWRDLPECSINGRPCRALKDTEYIKQSRERIDNEFGRKS
jgi:hypothetical protein